MLGTQEGDVGQCEMLCLLTDCVRDNFESDDYEPPPFKALRCPRSWPSPSRQTHIFNLLMQAVGNAGRRLHHFEVGDASSPIIHQMKREGLIRPIMVICFEQIQRSDLLQAARSLRF